MIATRLTASLAGFGLALVLGACGGSTPENGGADTMDAAPADAAMESGAALPEPVEIVPGLTMRLLREGNGAVAEPGQIAVVHYTGWLFDAAAEMNRGEKFDSSVDRGQHFEFPLGARRVIRGWDEGVAGMKVGEIRELTIAPDLAYGDRQVGDLIPPGSTLVFEVELAGLKNLDGEPLGAQ